MISSLAWVSHRERSPEVQRLRAGDREARWYRLRLSTAVAHLLRSLCTAQSLIGLSDYEKVRTHSPLMSRTAVGASAYLMFTGMPCINRARSLKSLPTVRSRVLGSAALGGRYLCGAQRRRTKHSAANRWQALQ